MTRPMIAAVFVAVSMGSAGCAAAGPGDQVPPTPRDEPQLVPPGLGTLRQDDVTMALRSGALLIKVTPLHESITRLTAPDTYERLSGMARSYGPELARQAGFAEPALFLVSFHSYEPDVVFQPEDLLLENRGLRYRPLGVRAVTPGWNTQRLGQQQTELAVYAFDPAIDLDTDLAVQYRDVRNAEWGSILPLIEVERAKVLARAGGQDSPSWGTGQPAAGRQVQG